MNNCVALSFLPPEDVGKIAEDFTMQLVYCHRIYRKPAHV